MGIFCWLDSVVLSLQCTSDFPLGRPTFSGLSMFVCLLRCKIDAVCEFLSFCPELENMLCNFNDTFYH